MRREVDQCPRTDKRTGGSSGPPTRRSLQLAYLLTTANSNYQGFPFSDLHTCLAPRQKVDLLSILILPSVAKQKIFLTLRSDL